MNKITQLLADKDKMERAGELTKVVLATWTIVGFTIREIKRKKAV